MSWRRLLRNQAWQSRPLRTTARIAASYLMRAIPSLRAPTVLLDEGRSRVVADLTTSLGLQLFRYGQPDPNGVPDPEVELVRLLLDQGDTFVDLGANVGLFTLVAAAAVGPEGRVIACEPSSATAAALRRNVAINGFSWVDVREVAVADSVGSETFFSFPGDGSGMSSLAPASAGLGVTETVPVTTLDALIPPTEREGVTVVKVDVEGAEVRVLQGGDGILHSREPDLLIEVEPEHLARQGASVGELRALLESSGYLGYRVRWQSQDQLAIVAEDQWGVPRRTPNLLLTTDPERILERGVILG